MCPVEERELTHRESLLTLNNIYHENVHTRFISLCFWNMSHSVIIIPCPYRKMGNNAITNSGRICVLYDN